MFVIFLGSEILFETSSEMFIDTYKDDIDETNIKQEIVHFSNYIIQIKLSSNSPQNILLYIHEINLKEIFPNVFISLQIDLTLPISNCEVKRKISKSKLIENV